MTSEIIDDAAIDSLRRELLNGFTREEAYALCAEMRPSKRVYSRDAIVIDEGEDASRVVLVRTGKISATKLTGEGSEHILAMHEAGDLMSLDSAFTHPRTSPLTFTALERSEVIFLDLDAALACVTDLKIASRLSRNIAVMLADNCVRLLYKTEVLSKRSLRDRIMTYLRIQQRKQGRNTIKLGMDREQFAQYLCVNRSALSRELGEMRRLGLVRFEHGDKVTLPDD